MISHLKNSNVKIAVVGLGYVGWPLFVLLSKKYECFGIDIDEDRIQKLNVRYHPWRRTVAPKSISA